MGNGVDPAKGQLLVPFNLVEDIIQPLERLELSVQRLNEHFEEHLQGVHPKSQERFAVLEQFMKDRKKYEAEQLARKASTKRVIFWVASVGGSLLLALVGKFMGAPI